MKRPMDGFFVFRSYFFITPHLARGACCLVLRATHELRVATWCPRVHHVSTGMPSFSDKPIRGIVFDLDGERTQL